MDPTLTLCGSSTGPNTSFLSDAAALPRESLHVHHKVIVEEHISKNGEHIDEDEGKHGCQEDGLDVLCQAANHIQQGVIATGNVKQLQRNATK